MRYLAYAVIVLAIVALATLVWLPLATRLTSHTAESTAEVYAPDDEPPEPAELGEPVLTRVLAVAEDGTRAELRQAIAPGQLIGRYYVGDGTGFNLLLTLRIDATFDLTWTGCLGVYGTAKGTWAIDSDGVASTTTQATGIIERSGLGRLQIVTFAGHILLVEELGRKLFDAFGPSPDTCLHRKAARTVIREAWKRLPVNMAALGDDGPIEHGPQPRVIQPGNK
jgi:hypothetical protein